MTHHEHDHDRGLAFDPGALVDRRRALQLLGGVGLVTLAGCASGGGDPSSASSRASSPTSRTTATSTGAIGAAACTAIPEETAGPFPGDGSNGPDLLGESGVVRQDIRSSFGPSSGVAAGVPLIIGFTVVSLADRCRPLPGAAIYAWHCDREGRYSMYSDGADDQNYLRGVQESGADGRLSFTSIFPGAYEGRWPHVHFEAFRSVADARSASGKLATSQLAFPEAACNAVYAADGYEQSATNFGSMSIDDDMVFADGYAAQLGKVTGSVSDGYTVELTVAV
jgi:protocatechuate 3,4-dioxygenase beta subunit